MYPCWSDLHTDLVRQHDGRAAADPHDGNGRLRGNEVQDLRHGLGAHVVLEHHAMHAVGGEGVADAGEQRPRVGVVDQHGDGVHLQGQVQEVLPAEPPLDLCLVGRAAEDHRHVHGGRGDPERPAGAEGGAAEQQQQQPPRGVGQTAQTNAHLSLLLPVGGDVHVRYTGTVLPFFPELL